MTGETQTCKECGVIFNSDRELAEHMRTAHQTDKRESGNGKSDKQGTAA
jgi:uncharacterized C2H2 Zn-finger protein